MLPLWISIPLEGQIKKARHAITNVIMKDISNIIKDFEIFVSSFIRERTLKTVSF